MIDPDLQLLLSSAEPLFMSRNPAVSGVKLINQSHLRLISTYRWYWRQLALSTT